MSESARYSIRTLAGFLAVPPGQRRRCLNDFLKWMEIQDSYEFLLADKSEFVWIDDGRRGRIVQFSLERES